MNRIIAVLFSTLLIGAAAESALATTPVKAENTATTSTQKQAPEAATETEDETAAEAQE